MQIDSADFEQITTPMPMDWVMRVVIRGAGLEPRAMRLVAKVGDHTVQGLMPGVEEGIVLGFLTEAPAAGDELQISFLGQPLLATGITFQPPPVS